QQLAFSGKLLIGVPTDKGIVHIPADVKHSRTFGTTGMEIGCQFAEPLPPGNPLPSPPPVVSQQLEEVYDAIMDILGTSQGKQFPSHERRIHPRVVFNEQVTVHVAGRAVEAMICYARDLSKGGLSFIAQERLPEEITVSFMPSEQRRALHIRCKVVRCVRIEA